MSNTRTGSARLPILQAAWSDFYASACFLRHHIAQLQAIKDHPAGTFQ
jgi:hypothetical protein